MQSEELINNVARRIYEDRHAGMNNIWNWDDNGLDDEHPGVRAQYEGYAKSAIAALSAAEPVAWQPRYKQEVIDHLRTVIDNVSEYAMTVFPTKDQAEEYGHGGHDVRALYAAPPALSAQVQDGAGYEAERLRRMVEHRDEFIIGNGLWDAFKEAAHGRN